jgi:ABC-2 type transport system permease protein
LALTITFLALLLAAGAIASERDENAIGRLRRGLISMGELVSAKVALAAVVALGLGLAIAVVFGVIVEAGGVAGGEPWQRLPLLAIGLLVAGAALGALGTLLGALARETRTASLVAVLVVMPVVFLGLVPREVVPVAGWLSDGLPFAHAVRYFSASLYDASPWSTVVRELVWLVGLGLVFGAAARLATRRLLA